MEIFQFEICKYKCFVILMGLYSLTISLKYCFIVLEGLICQLKVVFNNVFTLGIEEFARGYCS